MIRSTIMAIAKAGLVTTLASAIACGESDRSATPTAQSLSASEQRPTPPSVSNAPEQLSLTTIVDHLRNAGLPIGDVHEYTASTDPNELLGRPGQYIAKANFHDTRLGRDPDFDIDAGGSIEIFGDETDAANRAEYVRSITESVGLFSEYSYLAGSVLLRVSHSLTPEQAGDYERALYDLRRRD